MARAFGAFVLAAAQRADQHPDQQRERDGAAERDRAATEDRLAASGGHRGILAQAAAPRAVRGIQVWRSPASSAA